MLPRYLGCNQYRVFLSCARCMRFHKPPSTGWWYNGTGNYCQEWLRNVSLDGVGLERTRFAEWYGRDFPRSMDPVIFGFLFAFEHGKTPYPMEKYCLLKKTTAGWTGRHFKPPPAPV